jgi:hypothetical protein
MVRQSSTDSNTAALLVCKVPLVYKHSIALQLPVMRCAACDFYMHVVCSFYHRFSVECTTEMLAHVLC